MNDADKRAAELAGLPRHAEDVADGWTPATYATATHGLIRHVLLHQNTVSDGWWRYTEMRRQDGGQRAAAAERARLFPWLVRSGDNWDERIREWLRSGIVTVGALDKLFRAAGDPAALAALPPETWIAPRAKTQAELQLRATIDLDGYPPDVLYRTLRAAYRPRSRQRRDQERARRRAIDGWLRALEMSARRLARDGAATA